MNLKIKKNNCLSNIFDFAKFKYHELFLSYNNHGTQICKSNFEYFMLFNFVNNIFVSLPLLIKYFATINFSF